MISREIICSKCSRKHTTGFSLIELMVALTLGLILLAAITTFGVNSVRNYDELTKASLRLENARYAIQVLTDDIQHAGYYGELTVMPDTPGALPDPCQTTLTNLEQAVPIHIQGYNSPASSPLTCLPNANHLPGTDILVIRRASTNIVPLVDPTVVAASDLDAGRIYLQSRANNFLIDAGSNPASFNTAEFKKRNGDVKDLREYQVHIYFVSPCSQVSPCDRIPTLRRLELSSSGGFTTIPLVEGIENFQVEYGIDRNGDGAPNETNPGVSGDAYIANPADTTAWSNVVSMRIHLLARNIQMSVGHQDTKTYNLGSVVVGSFDDAFKRHAFIATARATNPSSRREKP